MTYIKNIIVPLLLCLIYFTSCQKNDPQTAKPTTDNNDQAVGIEDGYLVFKDWKVFKADLNAVLESSAHSLPGITRTQFTSANDMLSDIESKIDSSKTREDALMILNKYKDYVSFSEDSSLQLSNVPELYSYLVNKDGLVKIGEDLYKFTREKEYVVLNGTKSKMARLKPTQTTDIKNGIVVFDFKPSNKLDRVPDHWGPKYPIDTMAHTSDRRAYYRLEYNFAGEIVRDPVSYVVIGYYVGSSAILHLWGEKHGVFGWSKYKTTFHINWFNFDINCMETGDNNTQAIPPYVTAEVKDYYYNCLTSTIFVNTTDYNSHNYVIPILDISISIRVYSRGVTQEVFASYY